LFCSNFANKNNGAEGGNGDDVWKQDSSNMTFLSLLHPDPPICYGRCAWRVLYLSTNDILDDNEAPACPSSPFGAKFHDGTHNDTQIDHATL
jgi:hypothetical protein